MTTFLFSAPQLKRDPLGGRCMQQGARAIDEHLQGLRTRREAYQRPSVERLLDVQEKPHFVYGER